MAFPPVTNTAALNQSNKKNQTKGTGFTTINSILDANKGAGQKMGQEIGNKLTQQADSVRAGIQSSQNQFGEQKNQAGQTANNAVQAGQNLVKQAGENDDAYASRVAQGNQNYSQIGQNLKNAEYTGPMALQNAGQLQAQGATTAALGRLAGNNAGQSELLKQIVAKPGQYTRGQSSLDQLLLGQGGQGAIQQGRRSTVGLQDKAFGAADQAEAQAQALKSGIATNRAKAIGDIQNAVTGEGGFKDIASRNAANFQKDATDLSSVLSGNYDTSTPEGKQRAQDLVNKMGDFGLEDYNLYNEDPNAVKGALSQLAGSLTQDFGSKYYKGDTKQAALNLSDVLGDAGLNKEINDSKFNTDVFGKESEYFNPLDAERSKDIANRDRLNQAASDFGAGEQKAVAANQTQYDQGLKKLQDLYASRAQNGMNSPEDQASFAAAQKRLKDQLDYSNGQITGSVDITKQNPNGNYEWGTTGGDQSSGTDNDPFRALQAAQYGNRNADWDSLVNNYGYLASAENDPNVAGSYNDPWKNLGITGNQSRLGSLRTSQSLKDVANKQVSGDQAMRDFVLKQMLGIV